MGVISLLILVIIVEAGYLLWMRARNQEILVNEPSGTNNPINFPVSQGQVTPLTTTPVFTSAINQEQLFWFTKTHATAHVSSKIEQKYEGIVFEINSGSFDDRGTISTINELYISDGTVSDTSRMNSFLITEEIVRIASFRDAQSNTPFKITDLKKGDHVIIDLVIDLTKPMGFGFEQFSITRL